MAVERITAIRGRALPIRGHDIDTDRIIPARFLKSITFEGLEAHLFEDDRRGVLDDARYAGATIMLVNANFGCGSSREHAPQAIRRRGIRAIVGESFSDIFFGNSVALGMPCLTAAHESVEALMAAVDADPSLELTVDLQTMRAGDIGVHLPAAVREAFMDGSWDATGLLTDRFDEVTAVAGSLPYVSGRW